MKIWIRNLQKLIPLDSKKLRRVAKTILTDLALTDAEVSVSFVDDGQIRELNQRFLGRDKPTNVLAFSMREGEFVSLHPQLLGDVVISADTAQRQSNRFGLSETEMVILLMIHGILHLLGYEHEGTKKGARQFALKQKDLLMKSIQKLK
jgi:probable rRNA maturation factor